MMFRKVLKMIIVNVQSHAQLTNKKKHFLKRVITFKLTLALVEGNFILYLLYISFLYKHSLLEKP